MEMATKNLSNKTLNSELVEYINKCILPIYSSFDKGHRQDHIQAVWASCQQIIKENNLDVDINMIYVVAHYHDIGLTVNRSQHHIYSSEILKDDRFISWLFSQSDIETMAAAVVDHRASNKHEPRNIYGKIVADGDRQIDMNTIVRRYCWAIFTGKNTDFPPNCDQLGKQELFDQIIYPRICDKFGGNGMLGYMQLNFKQSQAQKDLNTIACMSKDQVYKIYCEQFVGIGVINSPHNGHTNCGETI